MQSHVMSIIGKKKANLRNWASADIFGQGERGSIFFDFVRTSFMDGP